MQCKHIVLMPAILTEIREMQAGKSPRGRAKTHPGMGARWTQGANSAKGRP